MSKIHFLREGGDEYYAKRIYELPIAEATEVLSKFAVQFYEAGPKINPHAPVLKGSKYKFVVLEVDEGEENQKFPKAGYYIIIGLAPRNCADIFGIYF